MIKYNLISHTNILGFFKPFWIESAKHLYRFLFDPEYRRYYWLLAKYGGTPRYSKRRVKVHGWELICPDVASFLSAYKEIFVEEIYAFPAANDRPLILDCGANIGLSILYLKKLYPQSKIIAYEADPEIFKILEQNIESAKICGIELHNQAIWSSTGTVDFSVEGADGGRINVGHDKNMVSVPSIALASILENKRFDFIKLDIEGAEVDALKGCELQLSHSDFFFIEFHSFQHRKQQVGWIIGIFERSGFRVHIHPPFIAKKPLLGIQGDYGMDMQLNLFFWKHDNEQA